VKAKAWKITTIFSFAFFLLVNFFSIFFFALKKRDLKYLADFSYFFSKNAEKKKGKKFHHVDNNEDLKRQGEGKVSTTSQRGGDEK
jgi:hypothetical protein